MKVNTIVYKGRPKFGIVSEYVPGVLAQSFDIIRLWLQRLESNKNPNGTFVYVIARK